MSQGDSPQSRESRHACRDEVGLGSKQKKSSKKIYSTSFSRFFFKFFFGRGHPPHRPPTAPEGFSHMVSAMCEFIGDQPPKSAVLSYQSLAGYRSLGFDNFLLLANRMANPNRHEFCTSFDINSLFQRSLAGSDPLLVQQSVQEVRLVPQCHPLVPQHHLQLVAQQSVALIPASHASSHSDMVAPSTMSASLRAMPPGILSRGAPL